MVPFQAQPSEPKFALIVDDDPGILDVYDLALRDLGFTPVMLSDGMAALERAKAFTPALVILDQRMPGLSGVELMSELKARYADSVPMIMVSAGRQLEAKAFAAGASAYLEKPFDVEDLIRTVLQHTTKPQALIA